MNHSHVRFLFFLILLSLGLLAACSEPKDNKSDVSAQRGAMLFNTQCSSCHHLEEKRIGPALGDVTSRRNEEWIIEMIMYPEQMTQKDPEARQLLKEYNNVQMYNLGINEADAQAIYKYLNDQN